MWHDFEKLEILMLAAGTLASAGWMAFGFYALRMVGQLVWVLMAMP